MARIGVEIEGVKDTLKTLRRIDPELRREFNNNARNVVKPIVDGAKSSYSTLPLSGFRRRWSPGGRAKPITPTTIGRFRSGVKFKVDTRKKARTVFMVRQTNAAAEVFDMAGRKTPGNQLDRSLRAAGKGQPSRVMWPAAERNISRVAGELENLVKAASETINRELAAR